MTRHVLLSQLAAGFDPGVHRALVMGNWTRTALWTARGILVLSWIGAGLPAAGAP